MKNWEQQWNAALSIIPNDISYQESADHLRQLIRTELLQFTDIRDNPSRFFKAHRMIVNPAVRGPGFAIRFTVQYNLFAGTIMGLGGSSHHEILKDIQKSGQLGCFGLTEKLAGVSSGLVVNTTATWHPEKQMFLLHCPTDGAVKNWISQGLTASKCVVIASLIVNGTSYGPHGFVMDMRRNGSLVKGVTVGDMGRKTTGNDLDNAWIRFDNVWLPKTALLNRFSDIRNNQYVQTTNEKMRLEVIGQRLLSGRVAIAQAALMFSIKLFENTKKFSDNKLCWAPKGNPSLSQIPQLSTLYVEADAKHAKLLNFTMLVEDKLSETMQNGNTPSAALVEAIAVAKIKAVENAIDLTFRLKQEVGSYALMGGTGFEHTDFLQCCKFAEGDSRILMQKIARDRVKAFITAKKKKIKVPEDAETRQCLILVMGGKSRWNDNWKVVYGLANNVMDRVMKKWCDQHSRL